MNISHTKIHRSSNVASVGYDAGSQTLEVKFHDGGTYQYHQVPATTHEALMKAPSTGKYIQANVRGKFKHTKA